MSTRTLLRAALACLVVGAVVMLAFEGGAARAVGVALLAAFIALGALAIASPEYLGPDPDREA